MISLTQALEEIRSRVSPLPEEALPLRDAAGRFLARDVFATSDSPPFDNSAVDGYAVQAADTRDVRPGAPCALSVIGTVPAGIPWQGTLPTGHALRIMTGAQLPAGADAVVMQEDARVEDAKVLLSRPSSAGAYVRKRGEEFRARALLLNAGAPITAPVVALLASQGEARVAVRRLPRVALITTGSEVLDPGERLGPGQIYNANGEGLWAALRSLGITPALAQTCPDEVETLRGQLRDAFQRAEVVITTGGVSVGDFDHVRDVAASTGLDPVFWKVALKPGKPTFFGTFPRAGGNNGLFFGLSGNPVGALLSFQQLVRPVLELMMGASRVGGLKLPARVKTQLEKPPGRLELVRGLLSWAGGDLEVEPILARESHMLLGLARADCVLHLPPETELVEKGASVAVEVLRWN